MEESSDDEHIVSQTLHAQTPLIHSPKLSVKLDWYELFFMGV